MEALVLIGGLFFIAVFGYYVVGRLGRFLDRGGISPYWDAEEDEAAKKQEAAAHSRDLRFQFNIYFPVSIDFSLKNMI